jgi:hydroxymethylpyrimidine/phosphomethylpyrimidine kinase
MKVVLTIAGSDSGGGAGLQADLKTFAAHGVHGTTAVTAVTAQNSVAVLGVFPLEAAAVTAQIEAVASDMDVAAAKTGMLASRAIVLAVAEVLGRLLIPHIVVDPVIVAKGGERLLETGGEAAYLERLFPLASVVTPNLPEAAALLGRPVKDLADMREAVRELRRRGPKSVVIKGGHLPGVDAIDVAFDGERYLELKARRVETLNTHGTGCTFSAAIAARLALGQEPLEAIRGAKEYITEAIRGSYSVGRGHGSLDQMYPLRRRD